MRNCLILLCLLVVVGSAAYSDDYYAALERHALAASPKNEKSLDTLANYLRQGRRRTIYDQRVHFWTRNWAGDEATAREIFVWVARRIRYVDDNRKQLEPSDRAAQMVLDRRVGVCHDYAVLYNALARKAELDAEYIWGMVRTGKESPESHAWNAVSIAGEWRMVDACWGGVENPPKINYKWFLLDPERFTETHLPCEDEFFYHPCCKYLHEMSTKKLLAIRHKMGTRTPRYYERAEW